MDYECDVGYYRTEEGTCLKNEDEQEKPLKGGLTEEQITQCDELGYYTVSTGYRKIPEDLCIGGLDLSPK